MKTLDMIGKKYNRLTVIRFDHKDKRNNYYYLCKCDCGKEKVILGRNIKHNQTKSCGCLRSEISSICGEVKSYKHGKSRTRLYRVFRDMKTRCYNSNSPDFIYYGGKGVKICDEWLKDYELFEKWALENGYDENAPKMACTIDRIDFNGDYSPENCRWVSSIEQNRNKTYKKSKWDISILDEIKKLHTLSRKEVAKKLNIKETDVKYILHYFKTDLNKLNNIQNPKWEYNGKIFDSINQLRIYYKMGYRRAIKVAKKINFLGVKKMEEKTYTAKELTEKAKNESLLYKAIAQLFEKHQNGKCAFDDIKKVRYTMRDGCAVPHKVSVKKRSCLENDEKILKELLENWTLKIPVMATMQEMESETLAMIIFNLDMLIMGENA